jgi:hypothetical protein
MYKLNSEKGILENLADCEDDYCLRTLKPNGGQ